MTLTLEKGTEMKCLTQCLLKSKYLGSCVLVSIANTKLSSESAIAVTRHTCPNKTLFTRTSSGSHAIHYLWFEDPCGEVQPYLGLRKHCWEMDFLRL